MAGYFSFYTVKDLKPFQQAVLLTEVEGLCPALYLG